MSRSKRNLSRKQSKKRSPNQSLEKSGQEAQVEIRTETTLTSGPLPPPEILEQYENTMPGASDRIFKQFEDRSQHSMWMERKKIKTINLILITGQYATFSALFLSLILGAALIYFDKGWYGLALVGVAVSGAAKLYLDKRKDTS